MAATLEDPALWEEFAELGESVLNASKEEIINRTRLLDNELRVRNRRADARRRKDKGRGRMGIAHTVWH